jgi:hypothetical protein
VAQEMLMELAWSSGREGSQHRAPVEPNIRARHVDGDNDRVSVCAPTWSHSQAGLRRP